MSDPISQTPEEVIYTYTRRQALADGEQVDANIGDLAQVSRQHYKYPVYMTRKVFDLIERVVRNDQWANDWKGVWHDVLFMSIRHVVLRWHDRVVFEVLIRGAGRKQLYRMEAVCGPMDIDDPTPVITFQLEGED